MLLRSHLRRRSRPPESELQDSVVQYLEQGKPHISSSRANKARKGRAGTAVQLSRKPLQSILKKPKPRFSFIRRVKPSKMGHRTSYYYEAVPLPQRKEAKKQVRFDLPNKSQSVRPAQSVSTHTAERKRSSTSHPRRESKSAKRTEPVCVAPGLSTITRAMQAEKPREMAKAKAKAEQQRKKRSAAPPLVVSTALTPRKEKRSHGGYESQSNKRPSKQPRLSELLGGADWARVTRRTVYGWYR